MPCAGESCTNKLTVTLQICLYPSGIVLYVADPDAIKDISMRRVTFPKPLDIYKGFAVFGNNIIASEGEEWRKYHRISAPAFSEVCRSLNLPPRHCD